MLPHDEIDPPIIVNMQAGYKAENWELNVFAAALGKRRSFGVNVKARF